MKKILIIILVLVSGFCYAQKDSTGADTVKVISMKEFSAYLEKINQAAQRQFSVSEINKYQELLKTIQSVYLEADRKRKK